MRLGLLLPVIALLGLRLSLDEAGAQTPSFSSGVAVGVVSAWQIWEASGLVASRQNPGVLWTHNDSGFPGTVFAISTNGALLGLYRVPNVFGGDFEDIAIGPGPSPALQYIYLGDIGDNSSSRANIRVFRIPEPAFYGYQSNAPPDLQAMGTREIVLTYPDGPHNAEGMMVDPISGDLFIATKLTNSANVYQATRAQLESGDPVQLSLTRVLSAIRSVSAADISADGTLIAMRRAKAAEAWVRPAGQTVPEGLDRLSTHIPVIGQPTEPNGEALAFHPTGLGYYTLSEGVSQPIYFFARTDAGRPAQPHTFILPGETWRYFDEGTDQGSEWSTSEFDDSNWPEGPAQFGYGQGDEQQVISYGGEPAGKITTTYFRKNFDVAGLTNVSDLALRVCFNDGIAIYINGSEVWRHNLSPEAAFDTPASADRTQWQNIWWSLPVDPASLQEGPNTIAVELHRYAADGPDLSFDLQLTEARVDLPAHFTAAPQITNGLCRLQITGTAGSFVRIEGSDDLQYWTPVGHAVLDSAGVGLFEEYVKESGARFYQLVDPLDN